MGKLKGLLSETTINERRAYGRFPVSKKRRASFCGVLNDSEFLNDHTGNRRFLICETTGAIAADYNQLEKNNIWRQAQYLYRSGERYKLNQAEIGDINQRNKAFSKDSLEISLLRKHFLTTHHDQAYNKEFYFSDIMQILQNDGTDDKIHNLNQTRLGIAMKEMGIKKVKTPKNKPIYSAYRRSITEIEQETAKQKEL